MLFEIQHQIRKLAEVEADLKAALAADLKGLQEGDELPVIAGKYGQKYQLLPASNSYKFTLPREEYQRLGILERCTPAPKLTKTELDKLVKQGYIDHSTIAGWEEQGWYAVENSGALSVKQLASKPEDLLPQF